MIPSPYHSQSYNRYSYLNNNPLGDTDSTGHAGDNDRQSAEEFLSEAHAYNGAEWTDANNAAHQTRTYAAKDAKGTVEFITYDLMTKANGDQELIVVHGSRPVHGQTVMKTTLYTIRDGAKQPMMTTAYGAIGRNAHATASFENLFGKIAAVNSQATGQMTARELVKMLAPVVGPGLESSDAFKQGHIGTGLFFAAMTGLDAATFGSASKLGLIGKLGGKFSTLNKIKSSTQVPHHIPQNAYIKSIGLSRDKGPSVLMTIEDHKLTRTFSGKGKMSMRKDIGLSARDRLAKDIRDLRANFGRKYNAGSLQAIEYAKTLQEFQK